MSPAMTKSSEAKLKEAFRLALEDRTPPSSKTAMAALIAERNPEPFREWAREKLIALVGRLWPKPADACQGFLFTEEELRQKIRQPNGKPIMTLDATITQLRRSFILEIRAAKHGALKKLEPILEKRQQLVNDMAPYAHEHHSKDTPYTVRDYRDAVARGEPKPAGARDRSAKAKAAWAKKTPAERRAIGRKRGKARRDKKRDGGSERAGGAAAGGSR